MMQPWLQPWAEKMRIREDVPLSSLTSFRIGGPADFAAYPADAGQLAGLREDCSRHGLPCLILGRGSNILACDEGYRGMVLLLGDALSQMRVEGTEIRAGAGVSLSALSRQALAAGLTGLEFAGGIPGSLGGALYMNAGAYGGEMSQVVREVTVLTEAGEVRVLAGEEMNWGYRHSLLQETGWIALEARLALTEGQPEKIRETMQDLAGRRRSRQPLEWPSAGSVFKRPEGAFAGQLIEEAGLKGCRIGDAQVSEKHAGFIINRGEATAQEVQSLVRLVQDRVEERSGIRLEPEIRLLGPLGLTDWK